MEDEKDTIPTMEAVDPVAATQSTPVKTKGQGIWDVNAIRCLIGLRCENEFRERFERTTRARNAMAISGVWADFAKVFNERLKNNRNPRIIYQTGDIREKWHYLSQRYKKLENRRKQSPNDNSVPRWVHFEAMKEVMNLSNNNNQQLVPVMSPSQRMRTNDALIEHNHLDVSLQEVETEMPTFHMDNSEDDISMLLSPTGVLATPKTGTSRRKRAFEDAFVQQYVENQKLGRQILREMTRPETDLVAEIESLKKSVASLRGIVETMATKMDKPE